MGRPESPESVVVASLHDDSFASKPEVGNEIITMTEKVEISSATENSLHSDASVVSTEDVSPSSAPTKSIDESNSDIKKGSTSAAATANNENETEKASYPTSPFSSPLRRKQELELLSQLGIAGKMREELSEGAFHILQSIESTCCSFLYCSFCI